MTYNLTFIDNSSGIQPLFEGVSASAGPWFGGLILMTLFLVLLIGFRRNGFQSSMLASSFTVSLLAGFLFGAGLLGGISLTIPFTFLVFSIIIKVWGDA